MAADYGCAVVISHDRWFLDRVATHILAFEGNSEVVWHEGNYQSYIEDLKKRKGADADQPHRIAHKKLVRASSGAGRTPNCRRCRCALLQRQSRLARASPLPEPLGSFRYRSKNVSMSSSMRRTFAGERT